MIYYSRSKRYEICWETQSLVGELCCRAFSDPPNVVRDGLHLKVRSRVTSPVQAVADYQIYEVLDAQAG
jgi:hypothetical protein